MSGMSLRLIDWIWNVRGQLALAPGLTRQEALGRLDPLFHEAGTTRELKGSTLRFRKVDPAAQDRMAVFETGELRIDDAAGGPVLRYHLVSRALLFCFLAPLLFLALAQVNVALGRLDRPAETKVEKPKKPDVALNPIDALLGAPAPDKGKKDDGDKDKDRHSPTPGYVFAGIFAVLWLVGRVLEDRLARALFARRLQAA